MLLSAIIDGWKLGKRWHWPADYNRVIDELVRKVADSGVTVVLVEHDMKMVMNLSDRILVLDYGKKLAEGTGEEVRRNPDVIAAYLGAGDE